MLRLREWGVTVLMLRRVGGDLITQLRYGAIHRLLSGFQDSHTFDYVFSSSLFLGSLGLHRDIQPSHVDKLCRIEDL